MNRLIYIFIALIGVSCSSQLSPEKYVEWIENEKNGLYKSKELSPVIYHAQYMTPEYMMLKNNETDFEPKKENIHYIKLRMEPADHQSQILHLNLQNFQDYNTRLQYFNFHFKNDILIKRGGKEFPCEFLIFQNNGKVTSDIYFTLGFDTQNTQGDIQLVITDQVFQNTNIQFLFKEEDLTQLPKLKQI